MSKTLTRRALGAAVLTAAAAQAQNQTATPAEELDRAREAVRRNRDILGKYKIDRAVEPAFQFRAF